MTPAQQKRFDQLVDQAWAARSLYREHQQEGYTENSFDARDWAKAFVEHVTANPGIPTDEATMTTWFANALMRGYDEHNWSTKDYRRAVRRALVPWWKRWFVPLERFARL
jgi:hypothetical protein